MIGVVSRILLRVLAGIMIGYGLPSDWVDALTRDPDALMTAEVVVGGALWAVTEGFYYLAKRFGWQT